MDSGNWRPTQGADPAAVADPSAAAPAGGDWRAQLQPEARSRIVNKIMETLKKHLPVSVPEGLSELQKIAVRFEEKIYTAATSQSDYLRKISLKMLSMESQTKTQQNTGNGQVIPNQNPPGPGLPPQGNNPAQSSAIPLMSQQQTRQPNTSTSVQGSSLPSLGQSLSSVSQTSTLQNMSVMPQNTMSNGLAQGAPQDIYAAQRRQQQQQQHQQQAQNQLIYQQQQQQHQQQAQNQLIYQQQQKAMLNQKLQQNSLMQPHMQQPQQQSLLQSTQMQSSQQAMMQMPSGLQPGQSNIPQTQPMAMQSATQSGIQHNPLNSVQQSVQSLLQQPRQQQHPQSSMHQQSSLQQA
ncbi:hypothetical protein ACP70R_000300 [Stipagrostis hirtigluma subsp. patula]